MTRSRLLSACLATLTTIGVATSATADDIDVFSAITANQAKPNILLVLDFSGSMKDNIHGNSPSTQLPARIDILRDAVKDVLQENAGRINVGIGSIYNNKPSGNRWPVSDLLADAHTVDPDIPQGQFTAQELILKQLDLIQPGNATATVNGLAEAAQYFRGESVTHNDADKNFNWPHKPDRWSVSNERYEGGNHFAALPSSYSPRDAYQFNVNKSGNYNICADYSPSGGRNNCAGRTAYDCTTFNYSANGNDALSYTKRSYRSCKYVAADQWNGARYTSPITQSCQSNFVLLISDGVPTARHKGPTLENNLDGSAEQCEDLSSSIFGSRKKTFGNCGPEILHRLYTEDQISSIPGSNVEAFTVGFSVDGPGREYLTKLANAGSGKSDGSNFFSANDSVELKRAISDAINMTLVSTASFTEPSVDVNRTSFSSDNRAFFSLFKPSSRPYWQGNLKGYFVDSRGIVDTNNKVATVNDEGGTRFTDSSQSFWSRTPDGNVITEGGAAARLQAESRNLYTFTGDSISGSGEPLATLQHRLDSGNRKITNTMMDVGSDSSLREDLLEWVSTAPMGAPLHSKPILVDYGNRSVVFITTNQGFLHAIDATNPNSPTGSDHTGGDEIFAFMPQELLGNIQKLENNRGTDHIYGLDGAMTRWHTDDNNDGVVNGSDKVMLVFGMRRGGGSYYAIDVTDVERPRLAWKIDSSKNGFSKLAQSWSRASLVSVNRNGKKERVLVFGGGYDAPALDEKFSATPSRGNAIYMVDRQGNRVWSSEASAPASMQYAIPSDLTVIDSDADGEADRLYVGDVGGQVWRVDFGDVSQSAEFNITRLADLGGAHHQPFFYPPSVSLNRSAQGNFLAVALGSGNRTEPLLNSSRNALFMLRDEDIEKGAPTRGKGHIAATKLYDATNNQIESSNPETADAAREALQNKRGWLVHLDKGEKALSKLVTFEGRLLATTFITDPAKSATACGVAPMGRFYMMNLLDATTVPLGFHEDESATVPGERYSPLLPSGIPSSPVILFPKDSKSAKILVDRELVSAIDQEISTVFWHSK